MGRWLVLATAAIAYLTVSSAYLSVYPLVGEDEPWIAAAPAKLAAEGTLGNDLFTGYYGMERHHLQHMPVYPVLEAGVFKLFGVGVWQMRALSVAFGLILLIAMFALGSQMGGTSLGAFALLIFMTIRITAGGDSGTGILFLDRARINRYDIAVPAFGLFALWLFNRARGPRALVGAGLLAGLSSLSHLYGAFWLPVLVALASARFPERRLKVAACLVGGFLLPWVPWVAYAAPHWSDYLGQLRPTASRFDVFNPTFYTNNLVSAGGPLSVSWVAQTVRDLPASRVGTWLLLSGMAAAVPVAVVATRRREMSAASRAVIFAAAVQLVMFGAFLHVKTMNYMIGIWPLAVLTIAWTMAWLWRHSTLALRIVLALAVGAGSAEGLLRIAHAKWVAERVTPYDFYTAQIAGCIPPGARVLGLQHYWLGLRQFEYRTWLLPLNMSRPGWYSEPLTVEQALQRVDPSVVLVDRYIGALMEERPVADGGYHPDMEDVKRFMADRGAEPKCVVRDSSYGAMQVYVLKRGAARP